MNAKLYSADGPEEDRGRKGGSVGLEQLVGGRGVANE